MINFISNLPRDLRSGGFSALNVAALEAIEAAWPVEYVGPVNPPPRLAQKLLSKTQQWLGRGRDFFFYSATRLETVASEVERHCNSAAAFDFFHGFTPWVLTCPRRPYAACSDCAFHDYIDIYHRRDEFSATDIARIEEAEAQWLKSAACVIFTSDWAAERTARRYRLDSDRVKTAGIFGEMDMPERDRYSDARKFAFVATDFDAKGGPVVLRALQLVRRNHPDVSLVVVGDRGSAEPQEGVEFTGFLRKEVPPEYETFRNILSEVRAIVHPTVKDISPHLIVEAAYFGCPSISTRAYAIPESVDDRRTGYLLDNPRNVEEVARAMAWMLENDREYAAMRAAAWEKSRSLHSKQQFAAHMREFVSGVLAVVPNTPDSDGENSLPR
jgi:glycosyltransferase involved in cell wall biosynthesis